MSEASYDKALERVARVGLEMDPRRPVTEEDVSKCEEFLGHALPSSYRRFLLEYGFGGVEDVEILGLISGDLQKASYVNAVAETVLLRDAFNLPTNLLAIANLDGDAVVCLQLSQTPKVECPIVLWDHSESSQKQIDAPHVLADSFGEYFLQRVEELIEAEGLIEAYQSES